MNIIYSYDENKMALFENACENYYEETPEDYPYLAITLL